MVYNMIGKHLDCNNFKTVSSEANRPILLNAECFVHGSHLIYVGNNAFEVVLIQCDNQKLVRLVKINQDNVAQNSCIFRSLGSLNVKLFRFCENASDFTDIACYNRSKQKILSGAKTFLSKY